jgi:hypothetical protein
MSIYGPVEILIVAMLTPFRLCRVAAPLALLLTAVLLAVAFQTEDSSVFGVPIDYATIGMRLPDTVFEERGWAGLGVWIGTTVFFFGGLGFWSLAVAKAFHPFQGAWTTTRVLRRVALFVAANLLVPIAFVSIVLVVLWADCQTILLRGSAFAPAVETDLVLLEGISFHGLLLLALPAAPITWLFLRLAIWPTIVLLTGWRHSLRTAWRTSRGFAARWLCHFLAVACLIRQVFDLAAVVLYEVQWQLVDMPSFDHAVLLSIAGEGIVCTVFLGFWMNAVMVMHVPEDLIEQDTAVPDIF